MEILGSVTSSRLTLASILLAAALLAGCTTTSGSSRLDETGEQMGEINPAVTEPENSAFYIQALQGGLISKIPNVKLSAADRSRALEAEYKVLESTPSGQTVLWTGSGIKGEVVAAVPYQVGSQNCRQYSHKLTVGSSAEPLMARGAACRNANGSWTPL